MGFDAVWISPIVKNIEAETAYGYAYHGCVLRVLFVPIADSIRIPATGLRISTLSTRTTVPRMT